MMNEHSDKRPDDEARRNITKRTVSLSFEYNLPSLS